eukprot:TRINITY_DN73753_c0_g1_i1.p1 TRINITY_DN73753_c0_g1~~TRINITY_DN73753_c0_g1_i1.p1  ORF type:complete len:523 (+),score=119.85 TRINITY_DN73753_c0_g1_i1:54-1571(+)
MAPLESDDEEIWNMLAASAPQEETPAAPAVVAPAAMSEAPATVTASSASPSSPSSVAAPVASAKAAVQAPPPSAAAVAAARAAAAQAPSAGTASAAAQRRQRGIPADILDNPELAKAIADGLPRNYDFEVHRTIWRLRKAEIRHVGLQMPEGLTIYATVLADIFRTFVPSVQTCTILGDVTFGACCIDDLGGQSVGVEFLVHYGHSCLVPTDQTTLTTLYVHVTVTVNVPHLVETVKLNFRPDQRLVFMGSVQFTPGTREAVAQLQQEFFADSRGNGSVPQVKPLGLGETLGCTSPAVDEDADAVVFVCDGRFHLESAMIQNPHVPDGFFRYDPFALTLTREGYAHAEMHAARTQAIKAARGASCVGLILGTLGRQGSVGVLEEVERLLEKRGIEHMTLLLSEVSPERLELFPCVDAWVQVACPRLSLDWGEAFATPLLTTYEAHVAFGDQAYKDVYPMDYYSNRGGPWSNYGAKTGHGGSATETFRHLRGRRRVAVGYDEGLAA